jgi:hypothetical protein
MKRNLSGAKKQRGLTLTNLLLWAFLIVFLALGIMKIMPAYVENKTITHILEGIVHDPEMQNATVADVRTKFSKNAMMNNITVINPEDIQVDKNGPVMVLSVKYSVKIPLVSNASLLLEFDSSTSPFH